MASRPIKRSLSSDPCEAVEEDAKRRRSAVDSEDDGVTAAASSSYQRERAVQAPFSELVGSLETLSVEDAKAVNAKLVTTPISTSTLPDCLDEREVDRLVHLAGARFEWNAPLLNIATIRDPEVNLSVVDYDGKKFVSFINDVGMANPKQPNIYYILGTTTWSSLTEGKEGRQIFVEPLESMWERAMPSLCLALGTNTLHCSAVMSGALGFGTYARTSGDRRTTAQNYKKFEPFSCSSFRLPWNADVPTYDGRSPFEVPEIIRLPPLMQEIRTGSLVLVTFTVSKLPAFRPHRDAGASFTPEHDVVSFNVRHVVLLHDAPIKDKYPTEQSYWDAVGDA